MKTYALSLVAATVLAIDLGYHDCAEDPDMFELCRFAV